MLERLQKIIARAGIASRRHAEQLILSGQVRVNGQVITELGSKADVEHDRIEAAGRLVEPNNERRVYIALNKPPEVVSTLADPEGRKTLKNCLRGLPERVYPVGRLDYNASGLVFLTNDGDLAAEMLKDWPNLQQSYHVKIKGRLLMGDLERLGRNSASTIRTVRQPDASRGHAENFWYEVTLQDSRKDILRRVLFAEKHPVEKLKRIALGPLTLEGLPQGRYRLLIEKEVDELRRALKIKPKPRAPFVPPQESAAENTTHGDSRAATAARKRYFEKRRPENKNYAPAANRAAHRKHGPRPSRPPSTPDREGYPNQESPADSRRPLDQSGLKIAARASHSALPPARSGAGHAPLDPAPALRDPAPETDSQASVVNQKPGGHRIAAADQVLLVPAPRTDSQVRAADPNPADPGTFHKNRSANKPFRPNPNKGPR